MMTPDRICYNCVALLDRPGMICPHCRWDNAMRGERWGRLRATTLKDGRFFIGRPLGAGGFGVTYLGRDLMAGEFEDPRRAIKEYFPAGMAIRQADGVGVCPSGAEVVQSFEKRRRRCQREGRRMAEISASVKNVVRAYDCFDENGTTYIVMEYIEGDTLANIVKDRGPFEWREACATLKPVLLALQRMHSKQFYHMDISPDNIMLRRNPEGGYDEPVILDFGASIEGGAGDVTRSRSSITVRDGFTPPEQYATTFSDMAGRGDEACRMDEYAVCATLYYAITGAAPTSSTARLTGKKLAPMGGSVPGYIESAIARGMSLKAADRFGSMEALIRALETPPARGRKAAIALACVLAAGLVFYLARRADILPALSRAPEPAPTVEPLVEPTPTPTATPTPSPVPEPTPTPTPSPSPAPVKPAASGDYAAFWRAAEADPDFAEAMARYLGVGRGDRFDEAMLSKEGVQLRLSPKEFRIVNSEMHYSRMERSDRSAEPLSEARLNAIIDAVQGTGLQLAQLSVIDMPFESLDVVTRLTDLQYLYLCNNGLDDISGLGGLRNLKSLSISEEGFDDLTRITPVLKRFDNLTRLSVTNSGISDIAAIKDLPRLESVDLTGSNISDYSPLAALPNLKYLDLVNCGLESIAPIASLSQVEMLDLRENPIRDFSGIQRMQSVWFLGLENCGLTSVPPIDMPKLDHLDLSGNAIRDFSNVGRLTSVWYLSLNDCGLTEVPPLDSMPGLDMLDLNNNKITDLSPIRSLSSLHFLSVNGNGLSDLSPLQGMTNLVSVKAEDNAISDISPLGSLTGLRWLQLRNNRITDISCLANLPELEEALLSGNDISDYSPVAHVGTVER